MKKQIVVMFVVWLFTACNLLDVNARQVRDYVVLTSKEMQSDKAWMKVVEVLSKDIKQPYCIIMRNRVNYWKSYDVWRPVIWPWWKNRKTSIVNSLWKDIV